MSTAKSILADSLPTSAPSLRGLPSRKAATAERVSKIRDLATALLDEAESLDHDHAISEVSATLENLNLKSRVDFFEEVRRFEIKLISRALELTGGNQARAARLLGLGTTTLNYKIKAYQLV